jgi:hypothetical protein
MYISKYSLLVFKIVCFLLVVCRKKSFRLLAFQQILNNFEDSFSNPHQRPYSGDFDPENANRKQPVIL